MSALSLPVSGGGLAAYTPLASPITNIVQITGVANRVHYAAAHVVIDAFQTTDPSTDSCIDWDTTLAFRTHLYDLGLGVAEAMDTAQRGMGLDWPGAHELIQRSAVHAAALGKLHQLAAGAGTDALDPASATTLDQVKAAYLRQCEAVEATGARVILMASRALVRVAKSPDDYASVYHAVLSQLERPAILHWLGEMFDPALSGYWGSPDVNAAMKTALSIIADNASQVNGIKISLLSAEREIEMRRQLPASVRMYTGDDFNFPDLIAGDSTGHSDALLGIYAAIAPAVAKAQACLDKGDRSAFTQTLAPSVPLSRHIFRAPTRFYKTGIVYLSWLNGHQNHFTMLGGQQSARSAFDFAETFRLADAAGLLRDPDLAVARLRSLMHLHGVES